MSVEPEQRSMRRSSRAPLLAVEVLRVCGSLLLVPPRSAAANLDLEDGVPPLEVHGFVSQGALLSTGNNYLARSKRGSFEFAEVGLNFTAQLTSRLRLGLQLFTQDLGPLGNYQARADWFYLDYRWRDWLGL